MLEAIMDIKVFIRRRSQKLKKSKRKNTNSIEGIKTIERFRGEKNIKSRASKVNLMFFSYGKTK